MAVPAPFKAAVLVNAISDLDPAFNAAFEACIKNASPDAQVDFFDPIEAQKYPEPGVYDLIVLTGGTGDAMAKDIPWILKMQEFLRTMEERCPRQKLVGVCWGHEVTQVAFGGSIGPMGNGRFEVGVTPVTLTSDGSSFFSSHLPSAGEYKIHEFHELEVKTPGKSFIALAEDNQCLINSANTILSFQGHPEMSAELSKLLLGVTPRYQGADQAAKEALELKINSAHDGLAIWKRIVGWAREG